MSFDIQKVKGEVTTEHSVKHFSAHYLTPLPSNIGEIVTIFHICSDHEVVTLMLGVP